MTHTRQNFRCTAGCCICTTKSSTSRFTSSANYEPYFERCFLVEDRKGEICNACVLIVKRFMKNPDSGHNWHHIVDNGHNKKNRKKVSLKIRLLTNTTGKNYDASNLPAGVTAKDDPIRNNRFPKYSDPVGAEEDDTLQVLSAVVADRPRLPVPVSSSNATRTLTRAVDEDSMMGVRRERSAGARRKQRSPKRKSGRASRLVLDVCADTQYWTKKQTCCGIVNIGKNNEVLLIAGQYKPMPVGQHDVNCPAGLQRLASEPVAASPAEGDISNMSDSSCDSFEIIRRDMSRLSTRFPSEATPSTSTASYPGPSYGAWDASPPHSSQHQQQSQDLNGAPADDDLNMDDYEVVDNVYQKWNGYYNSERQHQGQHDHPGSNVDSVGALDLSRGSYRGLN